MRKVLFAGFVVLAPLQALAQSGDATTEPRVSTPRGHDASIGVASYIYREPGDQAISIRGTKLEGGYTGTFSLTRDRRWFTQASARGVTGSTTYQGWCSPFLIAPNSTSPNGYELDLGDASPCRETGDKDWYVESRAMIGKDVIRASVGFSPATGIGLRHLSNGTTGVGNYRTDDYLYVPLALTVRTGAASHGALSLTIEYDHLLHGWQKTRDSALGGGDVPATSTAGAFTVDGSSDVSFAQSRGWAIRASARYQATRLISMEPYYLRWQVGSSPTNDETIMFTVNGVTAQELLGAYEPFNVTSELGVRLGFHFK